MAITIVISSKTDLDQTHWSVGYCKRCDCMEAIRVGDAVKVVSLHDVLPMSRSIIGEASCCDFCGKPALPAPEAQIISLRKWSHAQGLGALFEKCAPELQARGPQRTTDSDLHAMLKWIQRKSSINAVDIGLGMVAGALIGAAVSLPVGCSIASQQGYDDVRAGLLSFVAGVVPGAILGSAVEAVHKCRKAACSMVLAAYRKYQLDPDKLTELASAYSRRIRSAVRFALMQSVS